MHRRDDEKDGGCCLPGLSPAVSGPPGPTSVIPFRRTQAAALKGSVAGAEPPSAPAPIYFPGFVSLGTVVQAVVLRLKDDRIRLKVFRAAEGGKDDCPER